MVIDLCCQIYTNPHMPLMVFDVRQVVSQFPKNYQTNPAVISLVETQLSCMSVQE